MKYIIALLFLFSGFAAHAQTNLRAIMVDTNGAIQKPTNFWTANVTDFYKQTALQRGAGLWTIHNGYISHTVTNAGASLGANNAFRRFQTTASNVSTMVNFNPSGVRFVRGDSANGFQFSKPIWLIAAMTVKMSGTAIGRMQLGGQVFNGTNIAALQQTNTSFCGMGLIFSNGSVFYEATFGTNRSVSPSLTTYDTNFGSRVDIKLRSSGTGTTDVYVNNILSTNLSFGPTNDSSSTGSAFNASIESGSETNLMFMDFVDGQITIIAE